MQILLQLEGLGAVQEIQTGQLAEKSETVLFQKHVVGKTEGYVEPCRAMSRAEGLFACLLYLIVKEDGR